MASGWIQGLQPWVAIAVLSGIWALIGILSGLSVQYLPPTLLSRETWVTRPRQSERDGRAYERYLRVNRWKDRLPEAGTLLGGEHSKRHLNGSDTVDLLAFQAETRRAEYVHWTNIAAGPAFVLILPTWAAVAMTGFAVVVHLPFVIVQRYNRLRLGRILRHRAARTSGESQ